MDQAVERIRSTARHLADAAIVTGDLAISAISLWKIALLVRKERSRIGQPLGAWQRDLLQRGVIELPLGGATCIAAAQLEDFHADPADRLIVATVRELGATLLTADEKILPWPGRLDRRDAWI